MRTTGEFDLQKLRLEMADLISAKTYEENRHKKEMEDLKYQNEDNIKNFHLQTEKNNELQKQLEAGAMTLEAKENQILDLKESIVQCEIKNRRLLEQLNKEVA